MLTLTELCNELNNWFDKDRIFGVFKIADGELTGMSDYLQEGQYFRIVGSIFNDGVHKHPVTGLVDEVFKGAIWSMAVPPAVVELSERISAWSEQYGDTVSSPYQSMSESFGDYSRSWSKAGSGQGNAVSGSGPTWQSTFASELNRYRKI